MAKNLDAKAIIATTRSGPTAAHIARFRPKQPIVALCPDQNAVRKMVLHWGVMPFFLPQIEDTDQMVEKAAEAALEQRYSLNDAVAIAFKRSVEIQMLSW